MEHINFAEQLQTCARRADLVSPCYLCRAGAVNRIQLTKWNHRLFLLHRRLMLESAAGTSILEQSISSTVLALHLAMGSPQLLAGLLRHLKPVNRSLHRDPSFTGLGIRYWMNLGFEYACCWIWMYEDKLFDELTLEGLKEWKIILLTLLLERIFFSNKMIFSFLVWTWQPQVEVKSFPAEAINPLIANSDGTYLVGGSVSGYIYLWEVSK